MGRSGPLRRLHFRLSEDTVRKLTPLRVFWYFPVQTKRPFKIPIPPLKFLFPPLKFLFPIPYSHSQMIEVCLFEVQTPLL